MHHGSYLAMMPPFYHQTKEFKSWLVWSIFLYSLLVFNFLNPLDVNLEQSTPSYYLIFSGHALFSAITIYVLEQKVQPRIFSLNTDWNEQHSVYWVSFILVFICVVNWLYFQVSIFVLNSWLEIYAPYKPIVEVMPKLLSIYMIWALVCCMTGLFVFNSQTYQQKQWITLVTDSVHDILKIKTNDIICFQSTENHLILYKLNDNKQTQKHWLPSNLENIEEQLNPNQFIRCHQSFIVNKKYIKGLVKTKDLTQIEMSHLNFLVAVSNSNLKKVNL